MSKGRLMPMRRMLLVVCVVLAHGSPTSAATKRLKFVDENCAYVARYDPQHYELPPLKATLYFLYDNTPPLEFGPGISTPDLAAKADIAAYQSACAARGQKFLDLRLLDDPDVAELRRQKIAELQQACEETVVKLRAAKGDVEALRGFAPAAPYCAAFVDGIELTGDKFTAYFQAFLRDDCVRNHHADLAACAKGLFKDGDKPDAVQRMKLFVLDLGWHNCANDRLLHNEGFDGVHESGSDRLRKRIIERFMKQLKIKQKCESVD